MHTQKSKEWFVERIGKRIYRKDNDYCPSCAETAEHGLIVIDENHAEYLAGIDADFAACKLEMNYRDEK